MRTKTLLITAAIGAAVAVGTQAQVYSVNAVGYINLPVATGFNLLANQLDQGAGNNTVDALLSAALPNEAVVYKYSPATGYEINNIYKEGGEYEWDDAAMTLSPGEGFWLRNPADPLTVTLVGEVPQGSLSNALGAGFNLVSSQVPQAGLVSTDLGLPVANEDVVYTYVDGAYGIFTYYEEGGESEWDPEEPTVGVGQGFWVKKGAAASWDRDFSVNN
jgi:hypothetical protein